jgi:crotonobetaine/carnitine-CoA ligase
VLDPKYLAPHAITRHAASTPDVVALQHVDGSSLTYAQLDNEARRWAGALARLGVGAQSHVGTLLTNRFEAHCAMVALGWSCAIEVPLNTAYLGTMLHYALDLADVTVLVTESQFLDRVAEVARSLPLLTTAIVVDADPDALDLRTGGARLRVVGATEFAGHAVPAPELTGPADHDTACLLFTSGTTGPSKAVITPWAVVYQNWSWVPDDTLAPGQALYCPMPLFHNSGRGAFNFAMSRGGTLVLRDKFSATSFWSDIKDYDCRVAATVGPMTAVLWSAPPAPDDADNPLESVVCGPLIPEIEEFKKRFGVRVTTTYGQTEIGCPLSSGWESVPPASCGKLRMDYPWPDIRLADEFDEPVEPGTVGEMLVRTRAPWGLNAGYYKMPTETATAWRNGWFHTGDAFVQDDEGNYFFVDRKRDAIRRRGENISSLEVETLVSQHPAVMEVAAIGVPAALGEDEVLVALIVRDKDAFDVAELIEFLEPRMPRFMIPRYVEVMDDFPRVATSLRVKKSELRERGVTATTWDREASRAARPTQQESR